MMRRILQWGAVSAFSVVIGCSGDRAMNTSIDPVTEATVPLTKRTGPTGLDAAALKVPASVYTA